MHCKTCKCADSEPQSGIPMPVSESSSAHSWIDPQAFPAQEVPWQYHGHEYWSRTLVQPDGTNHIQHGFGKGTRNWIARMTGPTALHPELFFTCALQLPSHVIANHGQEEMARRIKRACRNAVREMADHHVGRHCPCDFRWLGDRRVGTGNFKTYVYENDEDQAALPVPRSHERYREESFLGGPFNCELCADSRRPLYARACEKKRSHKKSLLRRCMDYHDRSCACGCFGDLALTALESRKESI